MSCLCCPKSCRLRLREWNRARRCCAGSGKTFLQLQETNRLSSVGVSYSSDRDEHGLTWNTASQKDYLLHEVLLAGWGCPIGELFDLDALAEHCAREKRWSFFLTSKVCNVLGGVASPPNILAIF